MSKLHVGILAERSDEWSYLSTSVTACITLTLGDLMKTLEQKKKTQRRELLNREVFSIEVALAKKRKRLIV